MPIRTFKQKGQGYGTEPVTILAKINGETVFNGPIPTSEDPPPPLPDAAIDLGVVLFSWNRENILSDQDFIVEITVTNSALSDNFLILSNTLANYVSVYNQEIDKYVSGGPDYFSIYYARTVSDSEGEYVESDPYEDVFVGGVPFSNHPTRQYPGQWYWRINAQQTFTAILKTQPGIES